MSFLVNFENRTTSQVSLSLESQSGLNANPFDGFYAGQNVSTGEVNTGVTGTPYSLDMFMAPWVETPPDFLRRSKISFFLPPFADLQGRVMQLELQGTPSQPYWFPLVSAEILIEGFLRFGFMATCETVGAKTKVTVYNEGMDTMGINIRTPYADNIIEVDPESPASELVQNQLLTRLGGCPVISTSNLRAPFFNCYRRLSDNRASWVEVDASVLTEKELTDTSYLTSSGEMYWMDGETESADITGYTTMDFQFTPTSSDVLNYATLVLGPGALLWKEYMTGGGTMALEFQNDNNEFISPEDESNWSIDSVTGAKIFKFNNCTATLGAGIQYSRTDNDKITHFEIASTSRWNFRNDVDGTVLTNITAAALQAMMNGTTVTPDVEGNVAFDVINTTDKIIKYRISCVDENTQYRFKPEYQDGLVNLTNDNHQDILIYLAPIQTDITCTPTALQFTTTETINDPDGVRIRCRINDEPWVILRSVNVGDGSVYAAWDQLVNSDANFRTFYIDHFVDTDNGTRWNGFAGRPASGEPVANSISFSQSTGDETDMFTFMTEFGTQDENGIITVYSCGVRPGA